MKMNPFFEVGGKRYEIKRTRYLECEYEKLGEQDNFTDEQQQQIAHATKLQTEYQELAERFREAKENYFDDICNDEKEKIYNKFKNLCDDKYKELTDYTIQHKDTSMDRLQKIALDKGERLLILGIAEQYKLDEKEATSIWESYVDIIGTQSAGEWVLYMINVLFQAEEDDPFLAQAKAKAQQRAEHRRGLSKIKK